MKRTIVALAVAGAFLAPAAAKADGSGIVLTGLIHGDIGFGKNKAADGTKLYKTQPNIGTFATRWEIDGTEDLGWSQAIFGLAMDQKFAGGNCKGGIACNNNNIGDLNNRNSFLGLTGGWGTLKIGQNEHLYEIQQIVQDPDPASESQYGLLTLMTEWGGPHNGFTRRDGQSVWYASPSLGGAVIEAAYITPSGTSAAGTQSKTGNFSPYGIQLGVSWKAAFGLSLYGAYAQYNDEDLTKSKDKAFRLGVGYGMELFQVDVFGEQLKYTNDVGTNDKRTNIGVSGALNFGQHHIRGAFSVAGKLKQNGNSLADSSARLYYIGYGYTLSKRTELQAIYGRLDNKDAANFGGLGNGVDSDRIGVGIRHTF